MDYSKLKLMKPPQGTLNIDDVRYPCVGQIKFDGFRCAVLNGRTYTNSLKHIANEYVKWRLELYGDILDKYDGELTTGLINDGKCFNRCQSAFTARDGKPEFEFHVFDRIVDGDYHQRWLDVDHSRLPSFVKVVESQWIENRAQLDEYLEKALSDNHEGIILRDPAQPYKFGRATFKTQNVLRIKPMEDAEAIVVGFEEEMENLNEAFLDERGFTKRSSHQANKRPKGILANLVCECPIFGTVKVSGFTDALAQEIWDNRERYEGAIVTYKYQKYGSLDKPRLPKFKGFRDVLDLSM